VKNSVTHLKAQRARRPREQHIKIDVRHIDTVLKGIDLQYEQVIRLENLLRDKEREIESRDNEIKFLKKLPQKAAS
jgi:hypothetical protein